MDQAKLRSYLAKIAPVKGDVSSFMDKPAIDLPAGPAGTRSRGLPPPGTSWAITRKFASTVLKKVENVEPLSPEEMDFLEAIVVPDQRPVVDVVNGTFEVPKEPFTHLGDPPARRAIESAIPSVGRIELPEHPTLPFGGTGFVVGPGLLMTNRHVAALFAGGLGRNGVFFQSGRRAGIDFLRERGRAESLFLEVKGIVMIHPFWDMALLRVDGLGPAQAPLTLSTADPRELDDREVVVVGYPALDPRNEVELQNQIFDRVFNVKRLQPGRMGDLADVVSFGHQVQSVTHDCSTLGGNSGSAVVDVATGAVLSLHFAGRYLEANFSVPAHALALDGRIVDAGVNFDGRLKPLASTAWDSFWLAADPDNEDLAPATSAPATAPVAAPAPAAPVSAATPAPQTFTVTVPVEITVRLGAAATATAVAAGTESMVEPFHDEDLANRKGYNERFLGVRVPMPALAAGAPVSRLDGGSTRLHYEHFTAVMNKDRRLAHFLAANVDGTPGSTHPEPGRDYTREGLTDLGERDVEKWFSDPRIPALHQLPDKFFSADRAAFDKGHIIRRTYVAWGKTYEELKRANGDTFHVTNCSPQVAAFNRSSKKGLWGQLENLVQAQAEAETYSVFAGPIFRADDPVFQGRDDAGKTLVKIPSTFWKVIVVRSKGKLQAFAFMLDQDLSKVPFTELAFDPTWVERMVEIPVLEKATKTLKFPAVVHTADQAGTPDGESLRGQTDLELVSG